MQNQAIDIIITGFNRGDEKCFEVIYKRFFPRVLYSARALVKDNQISEDIATESFLTLWRIREQFNSHQAIQAFLAVATRNACINHLRKSTKKSKQHRELQYLFKEELDSEREFEEYKADLIMFILKEIENLSPRVREVVSLAYQEGLSNPEIASRLNIQYQTVKNLKASGIKKLRKLRGKMVENNHMSTLSFILIVICLLFFFQT